MRFGVVGLKEGLFFEVLEAEAGLLGGLKRSGSFRRSGRGGCVGKGVAMLVKEAVNEHLSFSVDDEHVASDHSAKDVF